MKKRTSLRRAFGVALGISLALAPALAQRTGGGQNPTTPSPGGGNLPGNPGGTTGGGRTGTTPQPTNIPSNTTQPDFSQTQPGQPSPVFLSGRVMMDDGTPPPESVVIQTVCNGIPKPQGYTDSKGHFGFQLGENSSQMMARDASMGGGSDYGVQTRSSGSMGQAAARLLGCELRAYLPGYQSDSVELSMHRFMDTPDLGTIVLHRMGNVEGSTISATSYAAPKDAKKAYEKAIDAMKKKKWTEAEKDLRKAVDLYPKYATAWFRLGLSLAEQKREPEAREALSKALQIDPKYIEPYRPLSLLAFRDGQWQTVVDLTSKLLRLDPVDFPDAYFYNAAASYNLRNMDQAEKNAREAVRLDTSHRYPRCEQLLALILAARRDYTGAAQYMKSFMQHDPEAQNDAQVRQQLAEIEKNAAPVAQQGR